MVRRTLKMRSDPANNDCRVDGDDAGSSAKINAIMNAEISASAASAMEPHAEDDPDSSEDEVVWKGRSKGPTIPVAQPPVGRPPNPEQRQSEAINKRMGDPFYYAPSPHYNFYPPYPQPIWPYPPTYPLVYPPAYPRFYATPYSSQYTAPTFMTPNHHVQHTQQTEGLPNVVHSDSRFGHDAPTPRNTQSKIETPNPLHENKTMAKKLRKTIRVTPGFKRKVRSRAGFEKHKKSPSALRDLARFVDKVHVRENSSKARAEGPSRSYDAVGTVNSPPKHYKNAFSRISGVSGHPSSIREQPAESSSLMQYDVEHSVPVLKYNGPRNYSHYPNGIRRVYSEPSLAAQTSAHFVPRYPAFPTPVLAPPLHTDRRELSDRDGALQSIDLGSANGENTFKFGTGDRLAAAGHVSVARSLSQQDPEPELDGQISRRAQHLKLDGLVISVTIQSSHAAFHSQLSIPSQMKWPDRITIDKGIKMDVKKAISAKRLRRRDGAYSLELHCDEGPASIKKDSEYQMQWLHMQTHRLNLADFENACLNAPGLSGEARFTLLRLFKQIQAKHRKQLFDGYSIEPGTVLRCDGVSPGDADVMQPSAIFICFPYLSVGTRQETIHSTKLGYPTRSILQTLYPYESTTFREEAPSFCSDPSQSADRVLYVPQCWIVILNSDTLLSCAELDSRDMMDPTISLSHRKKSFPPVIGHQGQNAQWARLKTRNGSAVNNLDPRSSAQALEQLRTEKDAFDRDLKQLFEEIHAEDYLVEDDESDASSMTSTSESSPDNAEIKTLPETRDSIVLQERDTAESSNNAGYRPAVHHNVEEPNTSKTLPMIPENLRSDANLGTVQIAYSLHDFLESQFKTLSLTVEGATKAEASMLAFLHSLECPQMTTKYLAEFKMYMTCILRLWSKAPLEAQRRQREILKRLQEGIARAGLLRSMCDLESQGSVFSENLGYRDAMLVALGIENSSFQEELERLGAVVRDAMTLFNGISDSNTTAVIKSARRILREQGQATKPVTSEELQLSEPTSGLSFESVKPFLTWISIDPELDERDNAEQATAEYLHTIMGEIEKSLLKNEESYKFARELAISELESSLAAPTPQLSTITSNTAAPNPQRMSSRQGSLNITSQILPSLGTDLENLPPEDALVRAQDSEVRTAIDDLFTCLKRFVGLYVACDYSHTVCRKIWGSMARLNNIATRLFQEDKPAKLLYIIRPLETGFLRTHKIKKPSDPIESCQACRDGQTYKSHQDAMNHLNIVHYGDTSLLRPLKYQETVRRYFVRTENDVRNERTNKQHLRLLQICIRYLKHLITRGEKLHSGFTDGEQTDRRQYQLPDGLVDCFEETALFLMQATTSVVAISNETSSWKHVPGKAIDDLETPAVQSALEKLGKLGESAKTSMTKAEKAIALAGLEESTVGMGNAGPELLASILLQNIGKRHLFEDVKMDVNQLYQEYTSKLQYQVNQFPRKRLLRTIHKLQEELTVVQLVNSWQQKTFTNFIQVLDPQTFEIPTTDRISLYPPESECISDSLKSLQAKAVELEALEHRTQYLREQLKQSVEILEEDHGKAILVFTMITTIFLPLSFVTSFFGMNTSDIRNTGSTQAVFWAIAIPVTAGIVFTAVLLAYRGDKLYDTIVQAVHEVKEQRRRKHVQIAPLYNGGTWRDIFAFAPPSWAPRRQGKPKFDGVEMDTLDSSTSSECTVTT